MAEPWSPRSDPDGKLQEGVSHCCEHGAATHGKAFLLQGSFLLVNLFWWALLVQTGKQLWVVIMDGGMERAFGLGPPVAVLIDLAGSQFFSCRFPSQ
jgi:hypothetical protein